MKRWIHAVTEPSAYEYGKALDEGNKRINDRFSPFKLTNTYFCKGRSNSTGYRITYKGQEWIADNGGKDSWRSDYSFKLYGPFVPKEINSWSELFKNKPIGTFKNINSAMTYLFNNVNVDEELDEDEYSAKKKEISDYIAKRRADVKKVYDGTDVVRYEGPDKDIFEFDLNEEEYDLEIQLDSFSMWCLESGAVPPPGSR